MTGSNHLFSTHFMKIVTLICRLLLGLVFVVFGLNSFLHFIPQPPPSGLALEYFTVMTKSHYMMLPFALQIVGGTLLLLNRYVPLALALVGPVVVNILMFHALMAPEGIAPGLLVAILWSVVFFRVRTAFGGIFEVHPAV